MQPDTVAAIWIVGTVVSAILFGVLNRRKGADKSFAVFAALWPALLFMAIMIGTFWSLSEFGAWIGRQWCDGAGGFVGPES